MDTVPKQHYEELLSEFRKNRELLYELHELLNWYEPIDLNARVTVDNILFARIDQREFRSYKDAQKKINKWGGA